MRTAWFQDSIGCNSKDVFRAPGGIRTMPAHGLGGARKQAVRRKVMARVKAKDERNRPNGTGNKTQEY